MSDVVLRSTKSVCPQCLQRIDAAYIGRDGRVFLQKRCEQHGLFSTEVWSGVDHFLGWLEDTPTQPPKKTATPYARGCPYDCGLCENHRQASCCILLEVTRQCNLCCPVCYAATETGPAPEDASLEQIASWYDMLMESGGPYNIQLSGGEPTLRDDLADIIGLGRSRGFSFFQLNTNGVRIADDEGYITQLADAGLSTVFLQFDSLSGNACIQLRGKDLVEKKMQAIANCAKAGVGVVLVPTVQVDCNDGELGAILQYAADHMPAVRGVHFQPISYFGRCDIRRQDGGRITVPALLSKLEQQMDGKVRSADFSPGSAEHSLCSFHADYKVENGVWTLQKSQLRCCGESIHSSDRARDAVAHKWSRGPRQEDSGEQCGCYQMNALDAYLYEQHSTVLAISGMAFQDAWTLDLDRLSRCHVHVMSPDGVLHPFCAYNLTSQDGRALHRAAPLRSNA